MMDIVQVAEHLTLLPSLNRKQIVDLLFNLGYVHKDFKKLLGVTHTQQVCALLLKHKDKVRLSEGTGTMVNRVQKLIDGVSTPLNSYEYFILYTLVDSPYITKAVRHSLIASLNYEPLLISKPDKEVTPCAICGYPTSNGFCLSCVRKIHEYTQYRRESFTVPVNYLNFNIRQYVNTTGYYSTHYYDWKITKEIDKVTFSLVPDLQEGLSMVQYELPFEEYRLSYS